VQTIIQNNDYSRLRLISAGVKAFVRQDSQNRSGIKCKWRIPSEGVLEVLPHVPEGVVVDATLAELRVFVEGQYPSVSEHLSSQSVPAVLVVASQDPEA